MSKLILSAAFILTLASAGCAKEQRENHPATIPQDGLAAAKQTALASEITCPVEADCHEAVGMLVTASRDAVGMCSASLVASDLLLTNYHCLPQDLREAGTSCNERLWVFFPRLGALPAQHVGCANIATVSGRKYPIAQDYAFIRLAARVNREPLKISRKGVAPKSALRMVRVDPAGETRLIGTMGAENCRAIGRTILVPTYSSAQNPLVTFSDCTVMHGNSGSPMLDADGRVAAVAQASLLKTSEEFKSVLEKFKPDETDELNVASNVACMKSPDTDSSFTLPAQCSVDLAGTQKLLLNAAFILYSALDSSEPLLDDSKWKKSRPSRLNALEWKAYATTALGSEQAFVAVPVPACYAKKSGAAAVSGTKTRFNLPGWSVESKLNKYLQREIRKRQYDADLPVTLTFSRSITGVSSLHAQLKSDGGTVIFEANIFPCP